MSLKIADNFAYQGRKPNFDRDTFSTLEEMKNFPEASIDEGHISTCLEDNKKYEYLSSNPVSVTTGKWRRVVDATLNETSENPVQNKAIFHYLKAFQDRVKDSLASIRNDFLQADNFISNNSFNSGLYKWETANDKKFFSLHGKYIFNRRQGFLGKAGDSSVLVTDQGRAVIRIKNKYLIQYNKDFSTVPKFPTNLQGLTIPQPIIIQFNYRVIKAGTLKISFDNPFTNNTEPGYTSPVISEELVPAPGVSGYLLFKRTGKWNGTGDLRISFTGEIMLHMVVLAQSDIELFEGKYKQLFQSSRELVLLAQNRRPIRYITTNSNPSELVLKVSDYVVLCHNTTPKTLTLPIQCEEGQSLEIKRCNSGAITINIDNESSANLLVDGTQSKTVQLTDFGSFRLIYDSLNKFWVKL